MTELGRQFIRVSRGGQDEGNQIPRLDAMAERQRIKLTYPAIRLHDVSAFKGEQQAAQDQVAEDIRAGRYTVLLCEVDRLDRRGVVAGIGFIYRVREVGGRVLIEAYEHSADPDEHIARDFAAAKRESALKSRRIRDAHHRIDAAGDSGESTRSATPSWVRSTRSTWFPTS